MELTPENQDEMDCRPLGRATGTAMSDQSLDRLKAVLARAKAGNKGLVATVAHLEKD